MTLETRKRLEKLYALAKRGVGGEKVNAEVKLEAALRKLGLSLQDLFDEQQRERRTFYLKDKWERRVLIQVIAKVVGDVPFYRTVASSKHRYAELTDLEYAEVSLLFDIYKKALQEEIEHTFVAFIHRNDLFGERDPDEDEGDCSMSPEEIEKLCLRMSSMDRVKVRKQLAGV